MHIYVYEHIYILVYDIVRVYIYIYINIYQTDSQYFIVLREIGQVLNAFLRSKLTVRPSIVSVSIYSSSIYLRI